MRQVADALEFLDVVRMLLGEAEVLPKRAAYRLWREVASDA
jgi:hypothetical protein